ncbi:ribonuclease PH [Candidatus Desulfofervidus auxilii]|uniref:Ribonuclease PH n=2 Tax=Desulfofervidus auxilii TaxID=1621989 RepID=A0A7U4TH53_DESA2|nr:ribonuclease PH [Candidatus Desulfofervidus auxilii]AMM39850.1 ribonuclease PH [Candidatus Desulfofervidus auxilii]CAD7769827.1 Ribonuclease PH [Candidatus Methanoperedenaceae archaeon GB37]CAD7777157.1 MAG: Ribonuclease PH [Candidatus Methanoperedenaceae archaeon GB37]
MREDGRKFDQIRPFSVIRPFNKYAEGSVLVSLGETKVIVTASVEESVPPFLRGSNKGWVTAEYSMLPRATHTRNLRPELGKIKGRTYEIQRMIGRSLRSIVDLESLGERTIWIDCDVMQADGGTRTASITGAFIALCDACHWLIKKNKIEQFPIIDYLAAISVGLVEKEVVLDLNSQEDMIAAIDANIVMTGNGEFVEIQATGEQGPFSEVVLNKILTLAKKGIEQLIKEQKKILRDLPYEIGISHQK